jgi:hypothetical protein
MTFMSGIKEPGPRGSRKGVRVENSSLCRRDGREVIVVDAVILVGDVACDKVQDATDGGRMTRGNANIEAATSPWFPFWDLLSVLKHGIKDKNRTAPDMGTLQLFVGAKLGASEELKWS